MEMGAGDEYGCPHQSFEDDNHGDKQIRGKTSQKSRQDRHGGEQEKNRGRDRPEHLSRWNKRLTCTVLPAHTESRGANHAYTTTPAITNENSSKKHQPAYAKRDGACSIHIDAKIRYNSAIDEWITSPAHRGFLSPRSYLAALLSVVGRPASRRRKALPSLLRSCKSRTLFSDTHKHTRHCPCLAAKPEADSESRPAKGHAPVAITKQRELQ
jgi:hypothetical protein